MTNQIIVISGDRLIGKTTFCLDRYQEAKLSGKQPAGIIAPAIFTEGIKTGFDLIDVATGDQFPAARLTSDSNKATIGRWQMFPDAFQRANDILLNIHRCDWLFIDELGPLEFDRGAGYKTAFHCLKNAVFEIAWVVIRPECIDQFSALGYQFDVITIGEK